MARAYMPLWCKSSYSFLEGASHPDEIARRCLEYGLPGFTLTDRDGVYGAVRAHVECRRLGLHLIIGSQITLEDGSLILLLAMNRNGYANLCRLISRGRLRCPKGESKVSWSEICESSTGLIALWGKDGLLAGEMEPASVFSSLRDAYGDRLYAAVSRHRTAIGVEMEDRIRERADRHGVPLVAAP